MSQAAIRLPAKVARLAKICSGRVSGGDGEHQIAGFSTLENATANDLAFYRPSRGYSFDLAGCTAGAVVLSANDADKFKGLAIVVKQDPRSAFAMIVSACDHQGREFAPCIDDTAVVDGSATIGNEVHIGANAVIGKRVSIGSGTRVMANVVVTAGSVIGENCWLHEGCVIGSEGFGFVTDPNNSRHERFIHQGVVRIGDEVEIGANSCVDRGVLGDTIIGEGSKIDNLVQIAHNVKVGKHVIICGQVAIGGSATIGDHSMLGGAARIADHVNIAASAILMGATNVASDIKKEGVYGSLVPHFPQLELRKLWREWIKQAKS